MISAPSTRAVRITLQENAHGAPAVVLFRRKGENNVVRLETDTPADDARRLAGSFVRVAAEIDWVTYGLAPDFDPVWVKRPRRHLR